MQKKWSSELRETAIEMKMKHWEKDWKTINIIPEVSCGKHQKAYYTCSYNIKIKGEEMDW